MRLFLLSLFLMSFQVAADVEVDNSHYQFLVDVDKFESKRVMISLPQPDGNTILMRFEETYVMAPALARKYSSIKTYKVSTSIKGKKGSKEEIYGRADLSDQGLHASLSTPDGRHFVIEPVGDTASNSNKIHRSVWVSTKGVSAGRQDHGYDSTCQLEDNSLYQPASDYLKEIQFSSMQASKQASVVTTNIVTYRIAVSATSSYVRANGGTVSSAMAAMVRTINRVNEVYERDAGIRLELVANNDLLVFASNDPFSGSLNDLIEQNQRLIDRVIGDKNYDIGHLFTAQGGGLGYVGSACISGIKALGVSGNLSVGRERFALEFVAHEIAHQFSATHTFNSNQGLCTSSNRSALSAYEPGSGSTIMSYFGICGSDNLQSQADAMFHIGSIQQMIRHKQNHYINGCGTVAVTDNRAINNAPVVDAGDDYVIPANTPFELKGTASDQDSDAMLYSWQQLDAGSASQVDVDTGNNALFRSYLPTLSTERTFPSIKKIINLEPAKGETLPKTNRLMHFRFIAQDLKGGTSSDAMRINVIVDKNRFRIHTPPLYYSQGEAITVAWEVANTNFPPISCATVDISLSTNNGLNFNQVLASGIPNTGSTTIVLPDSVDSRRVARLKIRCSDNIFFSISPRAFGTAKEGTEIPDPNEVIVDTGIGVVANNDSSAGGGGSLSLKGLFSLFGWYVMSLFLVMLNKQRHKAAGHQKVMVG